MKTCKFYNIKWDPNNWGEEDAQITGVSKLDLPTEITAHNFKDEFNPGSEGTNWLFEDTGFMPVSFDYEETPYNEITSKIVLAED